MTIKKSDEELTKWELTNSFIDIFGLICFYLGQSEDLWMNYFLIYWFQFRIDV